MHSILLTPPQTHALTAEEYLLAKLEYEVPCPVLKADLDARPSPVVLLDVRDSLAFGKEHIPGAVNVPEKDLRPRLAKLPKGKTIVTYGWDADCLLAPRAALTLARAGFRVKFLAGGISEWRRREFPLAAHR